MKKTIAILGLLLLIASSVFGQQDSSSRSVAEISLFAGAAFPYLPKDFNDYWKPGPTFGAGYGYAFTPGSLGYGGVHVVIEYSRFPFDRAGFLRENQLDPAAYTVSGNARSIVTVAAVFKGTFSQPQRGIGPYFLLGAGYLYRSSGNITATSATGTVQFQENSNAVLAWVFGAGLDVPAGDRLAFFAQAKFSLGVTGTTGVQYFPLSAGVRFRP